MSEIEKSVHQTVRDAGGRLTVPTRMVVHLLANGDLHLTADDLIAEIEARTPGIAPSTIYRVIQRLTELEVIEHVHSGNGPAFFHLKVHGHAHLVCNTCGSITDIPESMLASLSKVLDSTYAFRIDPHHSALLGTCSNCG